MEIQEFFAKDWIISNRNNNIITMESFDSNDKLKPVIAETEVASTNGKKNSKAWLYILIPLALIAAVWIWKQVEINNIKKEAEKQRGELRQKATKEIIRTNEAHLRLLAKPFVWSIRTEMLQGNLSQVHLYLNEMVKEKNFKNVVVANEKGTIVSSTNKKFEGQPFSTLGNDKYLTTNTTIVDNTTDSVLIMSSPIMGFDKRLGTLMITYLVQKPAL